MRRHLWLAFAQLTVLALPVCAASRVTVQQLTEILASARSSHSPDDETARKIGRLALKERLSSDTLSTLQLGLGDLSRQALALAADQSAFLPPPAAEIAAGPAPTAGEQQAMLKVAQDYVLHYVQVLPNLICRETIYRFDDASTPDRHYRAGELHLRDTIVGELTVRDGAESFVPQETSAGAPEKKQSPLNPNSKPRATMTTSGEFGSVLAGLFAATPKFTWRRWELVDGKRAAVFGYSAREADSRFSVSWSGERALEGQRALSRRSAYQGELSIDPASGGIVRLTEQALSLPVDFPIQRSDTAVEYRPFKLGARCLLFPARSITVMDEHPRTGHVHEQITAIANVGIDVVDVSSNAHYLNRVEFAGYRLFQADSKLSFDTPSKPPAAAPENAPAPQPAPAPAPLP